LAGSDPPPSKEKTLSSALAALQTDTGSEEEDEPTQMRGRQASFLKSVTIPGDSTWVDSRVDLEAGDMVTIESEGKVYWKKNSEESCGPDGVPGKVGTYRSKYRLQWQNW
jgi:hypothetical protein